MNVHLVSCHLKILNQQNYFFPKFKTKKIFLPRYLYTYRKAKIHIFLKFNIPKFKTFTKIFPKLKKKLNIL